ncbi:right-handed parallel beta-helix repeat-containing protein [Listeria booriae]|uniref:right-handed parallel beta-helix repeat-containing protein n=1 Tax=Listeria booriae TaxID=1552123 RepID=UPI0016240EE0|nr:right-handed parallel beta-helix repeat-containing protein [Listeria booriae]MBC1945244.1 right-handed parallel beta-helix repeat-containing protein [Listeria booriae]MBC6166687.1 right-handed parallel beta-helix repeat-containing protein [Listeria booriae]
MKKMMFVLLFLLAIMLLPGKPHAASQMQIMNELTKQTESFALTNDAAVNSSNFGKVLKIANSNKVAANKIITVPKGNFPIKDTVQIPAGVTLKGQSQAMMPLFYMVPNRLVAMMTIASGARVENIILDGKSPVKTVSQNHNGISIKGTSPANRVQDVAIRNIHIRNFADNGIYLKYTNNISITGSTPTQMTIDRIGYAGIAGYSANNTTIRSNRIQNIGVPGEKLAYNIALTSLYNEKLSPATQNAINPASNGAKIEDNLILNNAVWEGIDTHHGANMMIQRNVVLNIKNAILAISITLPNDQGTVNPPKNITIQFNRINNQADYARLKIAKLPQYKTVRGIVIAGAKLTRNRDAIYATGMKVIGNHIENIQSTSKYHGAILIQETQGAQVTSNQIQLEYTNPNEKIYSKISKTNNNAIAIIRNNKQFQVKYNLIGKVYTGNRATATISFRGPQNNGEPNNAKTQNVTANKVVFYRNYQNITLQNIKSGGKIGWLLVKTIADNNGIYIRKTNHY